MGGVEEYLCRKGGHSSNRRKTGSMGKPQVTRKFLEGRKGVPKAMALCKMKGIRGKIGFT